MVHTNPQPQKALQWRVKHGKIDIICVYNRMCNLFQLLSHNFQQTIGYKIKDQVHTQALTLPINIMPSHQDHEYTQEVQLYHCSLNSKKEREIHTYIHNTITPFGSIETG